MKEHLNYLRKIDMFGNRIELSYYKEKTHKTKFGGCLTVLLVLFSFLAIYYFGQEIVNKGSPNIKMEEDYLEDFFINQFFQSQQSDKFMLAIRILDYQQQVVYNNQIEVSALIYSIEIENQKEANQMNEQKYMKHIKLDRISCLEYSILSSVTNYEEFDFSELLCYRIQDGQLNDDQGVAKFDLLINLISNSSIQRGIVEIYYTDLALDVSMYNNPNINYLQKRIFSFEQGSQKRLPINLKKMVLNTDYGNVLTDYHTETYLVPCFQGEFEQFTQYLKDFQKNTVFSIEIQMDRKQIINYRTYLKLQDFLSSVGGIIKIFSLVFIFLSKKLTKLDFYMNLLNQIFNFEDPNEEKMKQNSENDSDEDVDEIIEGHQPHQIYTNKLSNDQNSNVKEVDKKQNFEKQINKSPKQQILQNGDFINDKRQNIHLGSDEQIKRKLSIENNKNLLAINKSESQIPLITAKFSSNNKEQITNNNLTTNILQHTETLIPLQLLQNPANNDQEFLFNNGITEEKQSDEKQSSESKENDQPKKGSLNIDLQILKDLEESQESKSNQLEKQVKRIQQSQRQNQINKDEENPDNDQQEQGDKEDNQKRNPSYKRRNAIPKNTQLISKFMHKVRLLLNNDQADAEQIETIKNKLNKKGNQYIQPENKPLKWGFFDYIQNLFWFGKARQKREQMKYCWRKVKERLNAVYIMQKLVELEKLKILLLDEHQLKLFDYLPKPMISLDVQSDQPNNSPLNRTQSKKSNEQSKNVSPTNPVQTPNNPNNTPVSQLNLENKQQPNQQRKSNSSGGNNNNNNNNNNNKTDSNNNQGNDLRQTGLNETQKSLSPPKRNKIITTCLGLFSNNQNKKERHRSQSLNNKDKLKKSTTTIQNKVQKNQNAFHQQWIQLNSHSTPVEKALHAMEAFEFIKNKQTKSAIDIKLVDMLDSRMKKCFDFQNAYVDQNNEENNHDISNNFSQFRQFFDGDNTIRDFLYPEQLDGVRKNRRARTAGPVSPKNGSAQNSLSNHFNNPSNSNNNSFNQSYMPFNNLNNLVNLNNVNTPIRRNFNGFYPNSNPFILTPNLNESGLDFSRYMNEFQQGQNYSSSHKSNYQNNFLAVNNYNNHTSYQPRNNNGLINRQRSNSPSSIMQAQMKNKFALKRQLSSISNSSNNQNIPNISNKSPKHQQTTVSNNKPSLFFRRLQTYDNNIQEEAYKNKNQPEQNNYQTQQKSYFCNYQQQQQLQASFNSQYHVSSGNSKKQNQGNGGSELSSPQKFEMDGSSSYDSHRQNINLYNQSASNIKPSHISHQYNNNLPSKNINLSVIESDLNTIEEDIPQENNTPTTISKNSNINESQIRKQMNTSLFQHCISNMVQSQNSPLKVTDALKKYNLNFQTMQHQEISNK
ncbi:transmembrane protein, putative (macronuclear) [Tetrahymena thermophila SB210]|uniref:Transmembrane protein, putative n=1 Tax=Tetrahymena thermophila (strain SB210) TaxID=312017 RepID=Q22L29_TETTS|nr:transmembrane protein, putative [Tetrahymena thermophila SB210]EAR85988.2 transmembrane protein, putative [Tetrahymena thermophila SB210]|eukprot:XP_976583.2 transmembrane protein, putative [Tetrahymena thermophila SB210]